MNNLKVLTICITMICAAAAHETAATPAASAGPADQKSVQRQRFMERRRETHRITRVYEISFFKLAPTVYDKMMTAVQACDKQMGMDTEALKTCTTKRMVRQPDKKKQDKKSQKRPRSRRQAPEPATTPTTMTTTGVPVVSDEGIPDGSPATGPNTETINSWREVLRYEIILIRCFVDEKRNTEFKDVPRNEWREVKDQKVTELLKQKAECMKKQLFA